MIKFLNLFLVFSLTITMAIPPALASDPMEEENPAIIPAVEGEDAIQEQLAFLMALHQQILRNLGQKAGSDRLDHTRNRQHAKIGDGSRFIDQAYVHFILGHLGEQFRKQRELMERLRHAQKRHRKEKPAPTPGENPSPEPDPTPTPPSPTPNPTEPPASPPTTGQIVIPLMQKLIDQNIDVTGDGQFNLDDLNQIRNNTPQAGDTAISQTVMEMLLKLARAGVDVNGDGQFDVDDINFVRNLPTIPETAGEIVIPLMQKLLDWVRDGGDANGDGQSDLTDINDVRNNVPDPTHITVSRTVIDMLLRMVRAGVDVTGDGIWTLDDLNLIRNLPVTPGLDPQGDDDPPGPDAQTIISGYVNVIQTLLGNDFLVTGSLVDGEEGRWRIQITRVGEYSDYAGFESLTYRVVVQEGVVNPILMSIGLHYVGLAIEPSGLLLWEVLSGTDAEKAAILQGIRILNVEENASGEQTVYLRKDGHDYKAYRNTEGAAVLEALPSMFDENFDYLNAGWPVMLDRLASRYGWVYLWETGEWDFDASRGTIPTWILDANAAAYHLAYEIDVLMEFAIKTHDLEKLEIMAKFYLAYVYGPESPFRTLAQIKSTLLEAQAFMNDLPRLTGISDPNALAALKISDLVSQYHLALPALLVGSRDLNMTVGYFQGTRLPSLMASVFGSPGDPTRGISRESIADLKVFMEELLRQHPGYNSDTTVRTIRLENPNLTVPSLFAAYGSGMKVGSILDSIDTWERRFRMGMDNPYTDADEDRLFLPYLSGEYGSADVDHPKAVTQLMYAAGKLLVEIAKMTSEELSAHPEFAELTGKLSNYILHDLILDTVFEQYEMRYPTVMGDDKYHTRWEWWTAIMSMTPEEIKALPDGRAAAIRDWGAFWIPSLLVALRVVYNLAPKLTQMTSEEYTKAGEMVTLILGLVDKQSFRSTVTMPDGTVITLAAYQEGMWYENDWVPADSNGGFDLSHFSNRFGRSASMIRANLVDAGLAALLPAYESWMTAVVNQLVFGNTRWFRIDEDPTQSEGLTFVEVLQQGGDFSNLFPLFHNYVVSNPGSNAQYRDGHPASPGGFGPYEMSFQVPDNWAFLADSHSALWVIIQRMDEIGRSTDPIVWAWVQKWIKSLHRTDATGQKTQFWTTYYGMMSNYGG